MERKTKATTSTIEDKEFSTKKVPMEGRITMLKEDLEAQ